MCCSAVTLFLYPKLFCFIPEIWHHDHIWLVCLKILTVRSWLKIDGNKMVWQFLNLVTMFFSLILTKLMLIGKRLRFIYYLWPHHFPRVILKDETGNVIIQTNGTEKVYDTTQNKTVDPFLAYTPNGDVTSVSNRWWEAMNRSVNESHLMLIAKIILR